MLFYLLKTRAADCKEDWCLKSKFKELHIQNVLDLREELIASVGNIFFVWAVLLKHFIPQVLLVLFINLACAQSEEGNTMFGSYGGYLAWPFQILGIFAMIIAATVVLIGTVRPDAYKAFGNNNEQVTENDDDDDFEKVNDSYKEFGDNNEQVTDNQDVCEKVNEGEEEEAMKYTELPDITAKEMS